MKSKASGTTLQPLDQRRQSIPCDKAKSEGINMADENKPRGHSPPGSDPAPQAPKPRYGCTEKEGKYLGLPLNEDDDLMDDPRSRTSSLDNHTSKSMKNKLDKLLAVFKNPSSSFPSLDKPRGNSGKNNAGRSGSPLTKSRSADSSVCNGQQPPRRRYMRVVRDADAPPPEELNDNPHIISHYSQEYLQKHYSQKPPSTDDFKPYTTTGHTILKKSSGSELTGGAMSPVENGESGSPSVGSKRATFFGEVEVIEYSLKDKVLNQLHMSHNEPIRFDDDSSVDGVPSAAPGAEKIAGPVAADNRVSFNNPEPCEVEKAGENAAEMVQDMVDNIVGSSVDGTAVENKVKDLSSTSLNYIFSPISEGVGNNNTALDRPVLTTAAPPVLITSRSSSSNLLTAASASLTNGSSTDLGRLSPKLGESKSSSGSFGSPNSSPMGSLCALQRFGGLQRRGTEEDMTMAA